MKVVPQTNPMTEALWLFGYIMALIWTSTVFSTWVTGPLAVAGVFYIWVSWRREEDTREDIGVRPKEEGFGYWWLGVLWLLIALGGVFAIGTWTLPEFWKHEDIKPKLGMIGIGLFPWAFFQQLLVHGYFTNRISKALPNRPIVVSLIIGAMFGLVHLPNPVLALTTPVFGIFGAWFFIKKSRNLYVLTLAHVALSTAVKCLIAAPLIPHGCMRVGPNFWNH